MNKNGSPTIKTAWEQISEDEGVYAYNKALDAYKTSYQQFFN